MTEKKEMSKREIMRQRRRRRERQRLWIIGLIVLGAGLIALALIYRPPAQVQARPMPDGNATGDPNAPIKIEEFSDYQCPFCKRFSDETEPLLVEEYVASGKVYFVYRSFGEWIGPESVAAAEAAYCAGDQNKYWEYHDMLFANWKGENVGSFSDGRLTAFAEALDLDMEAFNACFESGKYRQRVEQDQAEGMAYGISGTPGFVITYSVNGETRTRVIPGALPIESFRLEIEAALAEMGL